MQIFNFCLRFLFEAILPSHLGMQPHGVTLDYKFHLINHVISDKIKEPTIPQHTSFVTSWDKISPMSQFFHMELNIPVFRPHPVLQNGKN